MTRSLIVACSATKRTDTGELSALARYDGPAWRTLRANLTCEIAPPFALSAKYGLISAYQEIPNYDLFMTPERGRQLVDLVASQLSSAVLEQKLRGPIFAFGGGVYRDCLENARLIAEREIGRGIAITYSEGGIGEQLGQLKAWLQGEKVA